MAPAFIRSNIGTILPVIQQQLISFLQFPPERVAIIKRGVAMELPATPQADQYAAIQLQDEAMNREQIKSAGRQDGRVDRTVIVAAWSRLNVDEAYQANSWLTDSGLGYLPLENLLMNALMTFIPTDTNRNALAIPFHPIAISAPVTGRSDWGSAAVSIDVQFYRDVNQMAIFPGA